MVGVSGWVFVSCYETALHNTPICNPVLSTQVLPFSLAVLPSFEVSLRPQKAFFYLNDESLSVDIEAKYSTFLKMNILAICMFSN